MPLMMSLKPHRALAAPYRQSWSVEGEEIMCLTEWDHRREKLLPPSDDGAFPSGGSGDVGRELPRLPFPP
jgi:hypothetical protein